MADRYWVGGAGTWDASTTTNWATISGGSSGASAPTSGDNAIFDANSDAGVGYTVTISTGAVCSDLTALGLDQATIFSMGNLQELNIHGSMTLPASNLTWITTSSQDGIIIFKATSGTKTITTNGTIINPTIRIDGTGGTFNLGSALTLDEAFPGNPPTLNVLNGTFNTQNFNISGTFYFQAGGSGICTINLGSSIITADNANAINFTNTNLTLNAGTSEITLTNTSANDIFNAGEKTFYNVTWTYGGVNKSIYFQTSGTFNNLTFPSRTSVGYMTINLDTPDSLNINGTLTLGTANTATRRFLVEAASTIGTQVTITCNGTVAPLSDVDFRDIAAAGTVSTNQLNGAINDSDTTITVDSTTGFSATGSILIDSELITYSGLTATTFTGCGRGTNGTTAVSHLDNATVTAVKWTGTRIGNLLNNSGITFTTAADKYWNLAAGGNWSATAWALTSGGAVAANNFPLAQDKVIIENTGLNTSATITINQTWQIGELDISTRSNAMTLASGTQTPYFYKNIKLSSAVTMTGTEEWVMAGQGTTQILDVNTATFVPPISIFVPSGTFQLAENTTFSSIVALEQGTLNLNNNTLTCSRFESLSLDTRGVAFGTGNITVTGNNTTVLSILNATNFTHTGTPTVNLTYSGSVGKRTLNFGFIAGATESNVLNINITAGTDQISFPGSYKNFNFTGFSGTLISNEITTNSRTIFGNLTISSGMTIQAGTNLLTFAATSGTPTITSNGKTLDFPVTINGVGGTFAMADALKLGSTRTLTLSAGTIKFKNGTTNSAGTFVIEGSSSNQVVLNSVSNGSQYTLSQSSGTVVAKFATIKDSIATGGATYIANLDTNINGGNNTNWLFTNNSFIFLF
jgi:hypothetical protein